jgi:uncharacterized protein
MSRSKPIRIGVIADTHGLYDAAVEKHFAGVNKILHAGDIGDRAVIRSLRKIAPVVAVSGNVDEFEESGFPRQAVLRRGRLKIAVRHVLYEKGKLTEEARIWLEQEQPDLCIFGHSHRPRLPGAALRCCSTLARPDLDALHCRARWGLSQLSAIAFLRLMCDWMINVQSESRVKKGIEPSARLSRIGRLRYHRV